MAGLGLPDPSDLDLFPPPSPQQEAQKIFKANHPMDAEVTKAKVRGQTVRGTWGLPSQPCLFLSPELWDLEYVAALL